MEEKQKTRSSEEKKKKNQKELKSKSRIHPKPYGIWLSALLKIWIFFPGGYASTSGTK